MCVVGDKKGECEGRNESVYGVIWGLIVCASSAKVWWLGMRVWRTGGGRVGYEGVHGIRMHVCVWSRVWWWGMEVLGSRVCGGWGVSQVCVYWRSW